MRPPTTWLIADTHWYHHKMTELCGRPENFTGLTIKYWSELVQPQDEVIHLGDVILYQEKLLKDTLDALPGRKILIMGNHDQKSRWWYMRNGFSFATDSIILGDVLLNHRPVEALPYGVRICIHGHLHNKKPVGVSLLPHNRLLALEHTGYKPVRLLEFAR